MILPYIFQGFPWQESEWNKIDRQLRKAQLFKLNLSQLPLIENKYYKIKNLFSTKFGWYS